MRELNDTKIDQTALSLLRTLTGDSGAKFWPHQLEAIRALVRDRSRVLLVQRTGWGKSAVYFIATRLLRDRGGGPTMLVSPLLALMRNQIKAAESMGVRAATINSTNQDEWDEIEERVKSGRVDLLLISPERLANQKFRSKVLPAIGRRSGLLVVDEAHCISDWGHDFRPDYRRIVRVLDLLPRGVPVLCCTATANDRVVKDVIDQLGSKMVPLRGPLGREGLRLHVLKMPSHAERMAWLAQVIPRLEGTGVVYCLTVHDTIRLSSWLRSRGIDAVAYSGGTDQDSRLAIEADLLANRRKVVVATSALGMGFDKPDLAFVIHYQSPGSPITYYQQVGRAGRKLDKSWGILLSGSEERDIQNFFIESAFPPPDITSGLVRLLERTSAPMSKKGMLRELNIRPGQLEKLLKVLEVEGAIEREEWAWRRTLRPWSYDMDRLRSVTSLRRAEQKQMLDYISTDRCRMALMRQYLDDSAAEPCGICDNCDILRIHIDTNPEDLRRAEEHLRRAKHPIQPRRRFPDTGMIDPERRLEFGRVLSVWGGGGWSDLVRRGKQVDNSFDDRLVRAAAQLIRRTSWDKGSPQWVTFVPSLRNPGLVADFSMRLAASLGLACEDVVTKVRETHPQKLMQNSEQQYANVRGAFTVRPQVPTGPVLLVDDIVDSRWTMTAIAWLLRGAGSGPVYPFALSDTQGRSV
ncbi:MAG: RecQ family ATP-dependent DNA helicase [Acidimicrobiia bacterium]|nr:RecQ family ATP-dependent DNA helicase [Acidimicrobiia bacterium]